MTLQSKKKVAAVLRPIVVASMLITAFVAAGRVRQVFAKPRILVPVTKPTKSPAFTSPYDRPRIEKCSYSPRGGFILHNYDCKVVSGTERQQKLGERK